jgi:hypothetical protein
VLEQSDFGLAWLDNLFDAPSVEASVRPSATPEAPLEGQGTFFQEHVDLSEPTGRLLTDSLLEAYDAVTPRQRKRGREALKLRLRRVAANALRAYFFHKVPAVLYFRKADAKEYLDKPKWMRHGALASVVDGLTVAGLLQRHTGKKMPYGSEVPSWASSYWATEDLLELATNCGAEPSSIVSVLSEDDLVRLYERKPRTEYNRMKGELVRSRKGKRIWFEPTAETREFVARLVAINAFYRQQRIDLASLAGHESDGSARPQRPCSQARIAGWTPELFATDVYRVFNNGEEANLRFDQGGRLFGGWWMSVPEHQRRSILINGQRTIELDYANCHPRMLYHERGLECEGDLYSIPAIDAYEAELGLAPGTYRPCIKWLMQIMINGRGRPEAVEAPADIHFPPDMSGKSLVRLIEAKHQPIAQSFCTGAGLRLMRVESDIALTIVSTAMEQDWTVLSIHDSFIATLENRERLKALMVHAYVQELGKEPTIKGL